MRSADLTTGGGGRILGMVLLVASLACSDTGSAAVLELTIRKQEGSVTPTDVVRLERRVLAVRGVTLVSVSASRSALLIHHDAGADMGQIEAVLRETGFQWMKSTD